MNVQARIKKSRGGKIRTIVLIFRRKSDVLVIMMYFPVLFKKI